MTASFCPSCGNPVKPPLSSSRQVCTGCGWKSEIAQAQSRDIGFESLEKVKRLVQTPIGVNALGIKKPMKTDESVVTKENHGDIKIKIGFIPCPACNQHISQAAISCPKCGHPIKQQSGVQYSKEVQPSGIDRASPVLLIIGALLSLPFVGAVTGMGGVVTILILAVFPALAAFNRGESFINWYCYGVMLWIVAMPHSLLIKRA